MTKRRSRECMSLPWSLAQRVEETESSTIRGPPITPLPQEKPRRPVVRGFAPTLVERHLPPSSRRQPRSPAGKKSGRNEKESPNGPGSPLFRPPHFRSEDGFRSPPPHGFAPAGSEYHALRPSSHRQR